MTIKAIETIYNGYRFRSRLEARWAVFFDKLQIQYEYELQGFELPGGIRYLPDFYVPSLGVHVEVKPHGKLSASEIEKLVRFAADADKPTLLISGTPTNESMFLLTRLTLPAWDEIEDAKGDDELLRALFWEAIEDGGQVAISSAPMARGWHLVYRRLPPRDDYELAGAFLAAKQARFEFGETP